MHSACSCLTFHCLLFSPLILQVMLFDRALVVTRKHIRPNAPPIYQVIYNPHYTSGMRLEDRCAGRDLANSSFRTLRTANNQETSASFGIERTSAPLTLCAKERSSLAFTADNHHDAKAWVHAISDAIIASFDPASSPAVECEKKLSRSGSTSALSSMSCAPDTSSTLARGVKSRRSFR